MLRYVGNKKIYKMIIGFSITKLLIEIYYSLFNFDSHIDDSITKRDWKKVVYTAPQKEKPKRVKKCGCRPGVSTKKAIHLGNIFMGE